MNEEKIKSNYAIFEEEVPQSYWVNVQIGYCKRPLTQSPQHWHYHNPDHLLDDQVKRLDDKNQQFSADVLEKHNYIKELISDTKTGLQVPHAHDEECEDI